MVSQWEQRALVLLVVVGCGGKQSAQPASIAEETVEPPVVTKVATAPVAEAPKPPRRLLQIAWMKSGAGEGGFAEAVDVVPDRVVIGGVADLSGWTGKKKERLLAPFVASLAANGDFQWTRAIAASGTVRAVRAIGDGVLACGDFEGKLAIDGKLVAKSKGAADVFVISLAADGKPRWAFTGGSKSFDTCNDLAVLPSGGIAIAGTIGGEATFGELTAHSLGFRDAFVAKLDAAGKLQFVATGGSREDDEARSIAVTADAIYVTGSFGGLARFGGETLDLPPLDRRQTTANPSNAWVARYTLAGDTAWVRSLGVADSFDRGWSIAALSDGGVALAGDAASHPFVARYAPDGKRLWMHTASAGSARAVLALPGDEVLVAYFFDGALQLDNNPPTKLAAGGADSAIVRYAATGEVLASGKLGGRDPSTAGERDGNELEVTDLARAGQRIGFAGRLVGTTALTAGTVFRESPAQVSAKSIQDILVVAADEP